MQAAIQWALVFGFLVFFYLVATPVLNRLARVAERQDQRADEILELTRRIERNTRPTGR